VNEAQEADIRAVMLNEKDLRQTRSIEFDQKFSKNSEIGCCDASAADNRRDEECEL
jgi:hypothetical protein